jgi:hypothetical protein
MTIKEAQQSYSMQAAYAPTLTAAINSMIDRGYKTEFRNDSYMDALALIAIMLNASTSTVRVLTGGKIDGFIEVLKMPFTEALNRIRRNGGFVRIVTLNPLTRCMDELIKEFNGTLEIIPASASEPVQHYMLCDSKMARVEEFHEPLQENTDAGAIRATVHFNDHAKTKVYEDSFDLLWKKLAAQISPSATVAQRS